MIISADTQIGFLRDCLTDAICQLHDAREAHDIPASADASMLVDMFTAILRTVEDARARGEAT